MQDSRHRAKQRKVVPTIIRFATNGVLSLALAGLYAAIFGVILALILSAVAPHGG